MSSGLDSYSSIQSVPPVLASRFDAVCCSRIDSQGSSCEQRLMYMSQYKFSMRLSSCNRQLAFSKVIASMICSMCHNCMSLTPKSCCDRAVVPRMIRSSLPSAREACCQISCKSIHKSLLLCKENKPACAMVKLLDINSFEKILSPIAIYTLNTCGCIHTSS